MTLSDGYFFMIYMYNRVLSIPAEYDPNKHCGVWISDSQRYCTHSLTCKVTTNCLLQLCIFNRTLYLVPAMCVHTLDKAHPVQKMYVMYGLGKGSSLPSYM